MGLYDIVLEYVRNGKGGSVITVVEKTGAAPREKGAKMFVGSDGTMHGTIGGGAVEAFGCSEVLAREGLDAPVLVPFRMQGTGVEDEGMLCGGDVTLLIEPALQRHRELYDKIGLFQKKGRKAILVTSLGPEAYRKSLIDGEGNCWGDAMEDDAIDRFRVYLGQRSPLFAGHFVVEALEPSADLIIFGAGHVSLYVAKIAKMVHFNVTVIDDREDFANEERFPEADRIIVDDFMSVFEKLEFTDDTYSVIVTRGHRHDALVLEQCLKRPGRYIGMIGSRRKVNIVKDYLREQGFGDDVLAGVHAPIGIEIASETPEEIGVSIVGELIKTRGEVQSGGL